MIDPQQILTGVLLMLVGSLGTGSYAVVRKLFQMSRDIDVAHQKIRNLEKELDDGSSC